MPKTVEVNLEQLRQKKLFIATPMYGGMCFGSYTKSLYDLTVRASHFGLKIQPYFIYNESLIQRARNYCVDVFLQSDSTHMLFIDADISWNPDEVFMMLDMMDEGNEYDVVCGPYPKKEISWEKIVKAVQTNQHEPDPRNLKNFVGDYVFNVAEGTTEVDLGEAFEVMEAGTGFMMIKRSVFERIQIKFPKKFYKPDHIRTENFNGTREIYLHFDCQVEPKSKRYLSEDYFFCRNAKKAGAKIWMVPWVSLTHTGTFEYGGSLPHLASVGADMTASDYAKSKT